jgi:RNA polymerase sigma factor (sigma-70 family)
LLLHCVRRFAGAPTAEVPDALLLQRFVEQRDEAAFELLVWRHQRVVLNVCRRVLGREQDAEDAFQATFLALARKASSISRRQSLAGWLYRVAFRIALRVKTDTAKRVRHEAKAAEVLRRFSSPEPDAAAARHDLRQIIDEEMNRLSAKYRDPLLLCYLEGQTNDQAARQLGCPTGTVVTRLARGRKLLRGRLARRGVALSAGMVLTGLSAPLSSAAQAEMIHQTVQAAMLAGADRATLAGLISPRVAGLTNGVLRDMTLTKIKIAGAVLLTLGLLATGSGVLAFRAPATEPAPQTARERPVAALNAVKPPRDDDKEHTVTEVVTKSFKTGRAPRLVVETFNGPITVKADAKGEIKATLTKRARADTEAAAKEALKELDIRLTREGDEVRVTARRPEDAKHVPEIGVAAELSVPAGAVLDLRTRNGLVKLTGGKGEVHIDTANGPVKVQDAAGPLHLTTRNGAIVVHGGSGRVDLKTSNGPLEIERDKALVTAHTSNGAIHFKGTLADGKHVFHTTNGGIHFTLPKSARFKVDAETTNGGITNDFSSEAVKGHHVRLQTSVGKDPGASVELRTRNGSITIHPEP